MVFGNMGETSATGVAFTRNPSTGSNDFTANSSSTPRAKTWSPASERPEHHRGGAQGRRLRPSLARIADAGSLQAVRRHHECREALPRHAGPGIHGRARQIVDLQTRNGKRTARAALRFAVEMANEGLISREDAMTRVEPSALDQLLHPTLDPKAKPAPLATGRPPRPARRAARSCSPPTRRGLASGGTEVDPGPGRDVAGGHSRHARRRGRGDDARRHDVACGGGRARDGQALRLRAARSASTTRARR